MQDEVVGDHLVDVLLGCQLAGRGVGLGQGEHGVVEHVLDRRTGLLERGGSSAGSSFRATGISMYPCIITMWSTTSLAVHFCTATGCPTARPYRGDFPLERLGPPTVPLRDLTHLRIVPLPHLARKCRRRLLGSAACGVWSWAGRGCG